MNSNNKHLNIISILILAASLLLFLVIMNFKVERDKNYDYVASFSNERVEFNGLSFNSLLLKQIIDGEYVLESFYSSQAKVMSLIENEDSITLIYRYSEYMCNSCIYEELKILNVFQLENENIDVYVLVDYIDNRENYIRFKNELKKFKYFRLCKWLLPLPTIESINEARRYFAVIQNGRISYVYFPSGDNIDLTSKYLKFISKINYK